MNILICIQLLICIKLLICIQLREYTDLYTRAWHNTRLMQDHVAAISFTLITIVAHQN